MACTLTSCAATMYWSRNEGDTFSTLATLSKPPSLLVSLGSSAAGSMLIARRSLISRAYSVRLRRWMTTLPGLGCAVPAASRRVVSQLAMLSAVCWSGCGLPGGGIRRPCSLRTASSSSFASSPILSGPMASKATPPAQSVELWHFSQYCSKKPHLLSGSLACGLSGPAAAGGVLLCALAGTDAKLDSAASAGAAAAPVPDASATATNTRRKRRLRVRPFEIQSIDIEPSISNNLAELTYVAPQSPVRIRQEQLGIAPLRIEFPGWRIGRQV